MTKDLRTPEQLAEEWADCFAGERRKTVAKKSFYAGYQAAKDQLADADKVILDMEAFAETIYADTPMAKEEFLRGYRETKAKLNTIQPRWISVKERLPNEDESVLIYQPKAGCWVSSHDKHGWGMWENGLTCEPSHWMPLPEPPEDK